MTHIRLNLHSNTKQWVNKNCIHNQYGPAIEWPDGEFRWVLNGRLHRVNGPAAKRRTKESYYLNGKLHRLNGPAIVKDHKFFQYFIDGIEYDTYLEYIVAVDKYKELTNGTVG